MLRRLHGLYGYCDGMGLEYLATPGSEGKNFAIPNREDGVCDSACPEAIANVEGRWEPGNKENCKRIAH